MIKIVKFSRSEDFAYATPSERSEDFKWELLKIVKFSRSEDFAYATPSERSEDFKWELLKINSEIKYEISSHQNPRREFRLRILRTPEEVLRIFF